MNRLPRREFLRRSAGALGAATAASLLPAAIRRALAIPATVQSGTIQDVKHVIVLMQENRSFDHYFGTLRGVRGFGDPLPINLQSGKSVWFQSDGSTEIPPYHLNSALTSALLIPDTPHGYGDTQAAWRQGMFGHWPLFKSQYSMGYYRRADIPFQFALADAFTICDAYHCSLTSCTDPNRTVLFSGSNFDPAMRAQGVNCDESHAEVANVRCAVSGSAPDPGYAFHGNALTWPTLPEILQAAGISWRIYQDPNNNWSGLLHGGLAFQAFREAIPGTPIHDNGMTLRTIADLQQDVANGTLPQVSWIIPTPQQSEHPAASSPDAGAYFISQVLDAITANPAVWAQTALFIMFDENDGLFDHVPAPAVPSYNLDGSLAGASTVSLAGEYFSDPKGAHLNPADTITGSVRPWGLGPRVPLYVISPWSRGGWVNSQVFDHTSIGMFLEKRFGVQVPNISPWHRAVSGDLTSVFDFASPNDSMLPAFPDMSNHAAIDAAQAQLPSPIAPSQPQPLFQERGIKASRALPYVLAAGATLAPSAVTLAFANAGSQGAVFHVYDQLHLDRIPRRYTVEAGKTLSDVWSSAADGGAYDLWVHGPNGFVRIFQGNSSSWAAGAFRPEITVDYAAAANGLVLVAVNGGTQTNTLAVTPNSAFLGAAVQTLSVPAGGGAQLALGLNASGSWYDFTVAAANFTRRFAGRMETGRHGISDPMMALKL